MRNFRILEKDTIRDLFRSKGITFPNEYRELPFYGSFYNLTTSKFAMESKELLDTCDEIGLYLEPKHKIVEIFSGHAKASIELNDMCGRSLNLTCLDILMPKDTYPEINYVKEDMYEPFDSIKEVDLVFSVNGGISVVNSFENLIPTVRNISNMLNKGGLFMFSTNYKSPNFGVFTSEIKEGVIHKLVENLTADLYRTYELFITEDECFYSVSEIQNTYSKEILDTVFEEEGLVFELQNSYYSVYKKI